MNKPVSASKLDKWVTCQVRWGFNYLTDRKEPFTLPAQAGTETHNRIETNNINPDEVWNGYRVGKMAELMRAATPPGVLFHEKKFETNLDGIVFNGIVDLWGVDYVVDFKTTGKQRNVKSLEELADNIQKLLYGQVHADAEYTLWLYGVWEKLNAAIAKGNGDFSKVIVPRKLPIDRKTQHEKFKLLVLKPAEEMLKVSPGTDPLSLKKCEEKKACGLFPPAGCPYKSDCFPITKRVSVPMSSLFNTLSEKAAAPAEAEKVTVADKVAPVSKDDTGTQYAIEVLYLDCIPLDGDFVPAHPLISRASATVAEDNGVVHARAIDYGKGVEQLAVQLWHDIQANPVKHLYLDTKTKEGSAAKNPLMGLAKKVIQGI